ncbi:MAG: cyanophycinase [Bacteroidota bacterium]|nr:cyanophycinase [Bacteroidota bacterium]
MDFKGTLIPVGGNEDKGTGPNEMYTQDFVEYGILSRIVREAGGLSAKIVVITTASSIPIEVGQNYKLAFEVLGCSNIQIMDIRKRSESETSKNMSLISEADCIMFSGGDQSKITKFIGKTLMHEVLLRKLVETKVVIAGTSAGAMCMSQQMIASGGISEALHKGNVKISQGMGFLEKAIIDSHFIQRGRFGRLAEAVAQFPQNLGIGLAEDTGLVIKKGNECEIIGSGMVILFDPRNLTHNRYEDLEPGTPMSLSNLTTHVLAFGDRFKIRDRSLKILPLENSMEELKNGI